MTESANDERLWAYALDQLDDAERAALERALQADPALRAELDQVQQAAQVYRTLIPQADQDLDMEVLEQKILRGWEQSEERAGVSASPAATPEPEAPTPQGARPLIPFAWRPVLAMAACLVALAGMHLATLPPPLDWMGSDVSVRTWKGPGSNEAKPRYTEEALRKLATDLGGTIDRAYRSSPGGATGNRWFRRRADWRVQIQIHELHDGLLQIEVAAFARNSAPPADTWTEYAESPEDLRSRADEWAAGVATDLHRLKHE